jgi:hypothetical protein
MNFDKLMQRLDWLERSLDVRPLSGNNRLERTADRALLNDSHQLGQNTQFNRVLADIEVSVQIIIVS